MVVEVLVTQAEPEHALLEQFLARELDEFRIAEVVETTGEVRQDAGLLLNLAEQQSTGVGGDRAAVELSHDFAARQGLESEGSFATLCRHGAASLPSA